LIARHDHLTMGSGGFDADFQFQKGLGAVRKPELAGADHCEGPGIAGTARCEGLPGGGAI